jgi:hypothetical protein
MESGTYDSSRVCSTRQQADLKSAAGVTLDPPLGLATQAGGNARLDCAGWRERIHGNAHLHPPLEHAQGRARGEGPGRVLQSQHAVVAAV